MTTLTPDLVDRIIRRYDELSDLNGALALVAEADPLEILHEAVDVAAELDLEVDLLDRENLLALRAGIDTYLRDLRGRFDKKTLVIALPVLVDRSKVNDNYGPEAVLVQALRAAVDTVPYLSAETLDELETRLAVTLKDRS